MSEKFNKRRIIVILLLTIVVFGSLASGLILFWPQNNQYPVIKITIEPGSSLKRIAQVLNQKKVISNKQMFCLAVQLLGKEKEIPIGTFNLVNAKSNYEIIDQIVYGAPEIKRVRILEGWNIHQIASHLSKEMTLDSAEIISLTSDSKFLERNKISSSSIEGYLLPDTYLFFVGETPK